MRVIGLDIGERRIGVAVSDPTGTVATPLAVLDAARVLGDGQELQRIVDDYEVAEAVVGLPLTLEGAEGPQAARIRQAVRRLETLVRIRFRFTDERLSSAEASRRMREAGANERTQRGSKDMVAASIFLQADLDAHKALIDGTDEADA